MASGPAWPIVGAAPCSAVAARRDASLWRCRCRTSTPAPESFRFPRDQRLTGKSDLERVRHEGKRVRSAHLELRYAASPLSLARVGFIVPKHGQNSVARNRLKRRLRELVRVTVLPFLGPQDVVIRTLPSAYRQPWASLGDELASLMRRVPNSDQASR